MPAQGYTRASETITDFSLVFFYGTPGCVNKGISDYCPFSWGTFSPWFASSKFGVMLCVCFYLLIFCHYLLQVGSFLIQDRKLVDPDGRKFLEEFGRVEGGKTIAKIY